MSAGLQTEQSRGNPAAQRYGAYPATRGTAARPPDTLHPIFAKKGIKSMKKQNRNTAKRLLSLFMALAMCMSLFCTTAFAEEGTDQSIDGVISGETGGVNGGETGV